MLSRRFRRPKWLDILGLQEHRKSAGAWRRSGLTGMSCLALLTLTLIISLQTEAQFQQDSHFVSSVHSSSRRLLESASNDSHCEYEESHIPEAWVFCYCLLILICFIAMAIICDDFFVPSLEIISERLNLSEDVAGATFMAAGSSAPELFTAVGSVINLSDVGVGTIVGSAMFNLLIIIALTTALAGQVLALDWRPLIRDSFFYAMSIGCFIGFAWDGLFQHYEAAILLSLYALYIVLMIFNPRVAEWQATWTKCCKKPEVGPADDTEKGSGQHLNHMESSSRRNSVFHHHIKREDVIAEEEEKERQKLEKKEEPKEEKKEEKEEEEEEEEEEETMNVCPCCPCCPLVRTHPPSAEQAREQGGCVNWLKFVLRWIVFIPAFPFVCMFSWTIPDCSKDHLKKYYLLSFFVSVGWIAALSYAMVVFVERTGCILGIDPYIMGLVVVAIGTSIPDAMSSILVARDGYGDMAVSNAIGSNVFDINLGIGLPFIIRICIDKGAPIALLETHEWVDYFSGKMVMVPHAKFGFILLLILFLAIIIFAAVRFTLNKWIGISFVIFYVMFLTYAFIQELYCVRQKDMYC